MVAIELRNYANVHKMSNQRKPNLHRLGKTGRYLQLRSFIFFAPQDLYSGSCPKVVILAQLLLLQRCGPKWTK